MALTLSGTNGVVGAGFTVDASGVSVTAGVGTFTSYQGSAASLTQIPAANIVGVCTAGLGNASGGFSQGIITMVDTYRLATSFQGDADPLVNLEQSDDATSGFIGTGMTYNSGIFTFPSTGIYYVNFVSVHFYSGTDRNIIIKIRVSSDSGSSYDTIATSMTSVFGAGLNTQCNCNASAIIDVTNASTFRCKGFVEVQDNSVYTNAATNSDQTFLRFIRLGDT